MLDIVTMVFESTSMRYETLVARFWLRVRRVPQSSCRRQSRDKRQELWGREWAQHRGILSAHAPRSTVNEKNRWYAPGRKNNGDLREKSVLG